MFAEHHYHTYNSTTHEHRAPTDESVRLLKEFEEAARKKIEASIRLDNNMFKAHIMKSPDYMAWDKTYVVLYELNGQKQRCEIKVSDLQAKNEDATKFFVLGELGKHIAANILQEAFSQINDHYTKVGFFK